MATPSVFPDQGGATPGDATEISEPSKPPITPQELDQVLAPVALYPDTLVSQILMASTYPLEVVQADRWVQQNKALTGDSLAVELEKQPWDPSVKSLVNFPQVLDMMNSKLDWTIKLGDAFLEQQTDVMDTIQSLRAKAQTAGNLTSNEQQIVTVEAATPTQPQVIVIQPADPQIIYVPTYNPTIIYGPWWYPAYPPYYYYPPGYVPGRVMISFGIGFRVGMAWGYAWGGCNWRSRNVNVNINRNVNINVHINRNRYQNNFNRINVKGGQGNWKHDPSHRQGVAYRDRLTAKQFGQGSSDQAQKAREQFRGRVGNAGGNQNGSGAGGRPGQPGQRPQQPAQLPARSPNSPSQLPQRPDQGSGQRPSRPAGSRGGAFDGDSSGGADARRDSQRGSASRGGERGGGGGAGRAGGGGGGQGRQGGGGGRPKQ